MAGKLFQIEEPDGSPLDPTGPGAAVGIGIRKGGRVPAGHSLQGAVAFAVGGNAELLPSSDGERVLESGDLTELVLGLRSCAEKQLARPVTHAVVMSPPIEDGPLALAIEAAGLILLDSVDPGSKSPEAAALEAAALAEDLASEDLAPKDLAPKHRAPKTELRFSCRR